MACVIEEPEDWEREYDVIPVASGVTVDPQPFPAEGLQDRPAGRCSGKLHRPAQEIGDYKGGHFMRSMQWGNPLKMDGIGREVSSPDVLRHVTATCSSLVREEAVRESPVTDVKVAMVAAEVSRPVPVESEVGDSQVFVVPSKDPGEVKKQALWPPLE